MNNNTKLKIKNALGKRLIEKNYLEYSEAITRLLAKRPELIEQLLESLQIPENVFWDYISGDVKTNITFYDTTLCLLKELTENEKTQML